MSSSDFFSIFISIKLQSYDLDVFKHYIEIINSLLQWGVLSLHSDPFVLCAIIPIKSYFNAEQDKAQILSDNKNKSGIYMFKNLTNGKRYIGSSENLNRRFREYFNINYLLKNKSMYICNSLIKHGYFNFSLTILEYCSPDKCLFRSVPCCEYSRRFRSKYYINLFGSEYNIIKDPSLPPMSGRKHLEKTKTKISEANKGTTRSDETKKIMSDTRKGKPKIEGSGSPSQAIEVRRSRPASQALILQIILDFL